MLETIKFHLAPKQVPLCRVSPASDPVFEVLGAQHSLRLLIQWNDSSFYLKVLLQGSTQLYSMFMIYKENHDFPIICQKTKQTKHSDYYLLIGTWP